MNRRHDRISAMFIDAVLNGSPRHGIAHAARVIFRVVPRVGGNDDGGEPTERRKDRTLPCEEYVFATRATSAGVTDSVRAYSSRK